MSQKKLNIRKAVTLAVSPPEGGEAENKIVAESKAPKETEKNQNESMADEKEGEKGEKKEGPKGSTKKLYESVEEELKAAEHGRLMLKSSFLERAKDGYDPSEELQSPLVAKKKGNVTSFLCLIFD